MVSPVVGLLPLASGLTCLGMAFPPFLVKQLYSCDSVVISSFVRTGYTTKRWGWMLGRIGYSTWYVRPERVNKWPNSMKDIWWWSSSFLQEKNVIYHEWQIISHKYLYSFLSRPFQFSTNTLTAPFDAVTYSPKSKVFHPEVFGTYL